MIITIDGPAASGKSTMARMLADDLNIYYINSGLLYRALSYLLLNQGGYTSYTVGNPTESDVKKFLDPQRLTYTYDNIDGEQVAFDGVVLRIDQLKTPVIDDAASVVSTHAYVRESVVALERALTSQHSVVIDGRDSGSVVFPDADIKFFLTASLAVRAQRWTRARHDQGKVADFESVRALIAQRDERDKKRTISPLVVPDGAIILDNSALDAAQTFSVMREHVAKAVSSL